MTHPKQMIKITKIFKIKGAQVYHVILLTDTGKIKHEVYTNKEAALERTEHAAAIEEV